MEIEADKFISAGTKWHQYIAREKQVPKAAYKVQVFIFGKIFPPQDFG